MGALELILLASLPLVLLVGLFDSADDPPEGEGPAAPDPGEDLATGENLLDYMDWSARDGGAAAGSPEAAVPDADATGSDVATSGATGSDATGSGTTGSGATGSGATGSGATGSGGTASGVSGSGSALPGSTGPESTGFGVAGPGSTGSDSAGPDDLDIGAHVPGAPDGPADAPSQVPETDSDHLAPRTAGAVTAPDSGPSPPLPDDDHGTGVPIPPEFGRFAARDPILGSGGSDTLAAGDGGDVLFANGLDGGAEAGNLLLGGKGDDTLLGGRGPDRLVAGAGDNLLHGSYGPELEIAQGSDLFAWRDNGLPDTLEGGPGDDRLVLARGDVASGGGGSNVFEVWHDPESAQPVAVITDFDPATDRLDVVVRIDEQAHPGCDGWAWDRSLRAAVFETARLEVRTSPDGAATEVLVEGEPVARLPGAPALTAEAVRVFAFWDIVS